MSTFISSPRTVKEPNKKKVRQLAKALRLKKMESGEEMDVEFTTSRRERKALALAAARQAAEPSAAQLPRGHVGDGSGTTLGGVSHRRG